MVTVSLKKRLIIYIMLIFLLIMTVIGYILVVQQRDIFQEEIERRGKLLARTLADISKEAILIHEFSTLVQNVRSFEDEKDLIGAKIINNEGRILASLNREEEGSFTDFDYSEDQLLWENNNLITVDTINVNGVDMGKSIVVLSQQSMLDRINYSIKLIMLILTVALVLLIIIINITAEYFFEPLTILAERVRKIPEDDFDIKTLEKAEPPEELNELYNSIGWMYEEMLVIRKRLVEKAQMATIGKMSAYLAHEIRNPLEAISGSVEVMKLKGDLNSDGGFYNILKEEITSLNSFLDEFLSFARIKSYDFEKINLNNLINDIFVLLKPMLQNKKIKLIKKFNNQEAYINGDTNKIKSVFTNILLNSIEAVGKKGYIKIVLSNDEKFITVLIKDNGSGIKEKNLEKIFDPFFTTKKSGSGIGLSISKEIIERHDGIIDVESNNNTVFKIKLPIFKDDNNNGKNTNS